MVIFQTRPVAWTDKRLGEACARAALAPDYPGAHTIAWRAAAVSFTEAHRAGAIGNIKRAAELRASAMAQLDRAGLRVEQAVTGEVLEREMAAAPAPVTPAQHKASMIAECSARMLYLRESAEVTAFPYATVAAIHYAAASCYERAVREWIAGRTDPAMTWQRAAEHTLANHQVTAPWHTPDPTV